MNLMDRGDEIMEICEQCHICASKVPIFSDLEVKQLREIDKLIKHHTYQKGEIIYLAGHASQNIYILNSGRVKVFKTSAGGKEQILRLLYDGDFFGDLVLFKEIIHSVSAEAITDCEICVINQQELEKMIRKNNDLACSLLTAFSERLKEAEGMIESLALQDSREKTINLLKKLANENGVKTDQGIKIELPLSRAGLASFLAITQETLSRKLSELQSSDQIEINGWKEVIIKDPYLIEQIEQ